MRMGNGQIFQIVDIGIPADHPLRNMGRQNQQEGGPSG